MGALVITHYQRILNYITARLRPRVRRRAYRGGRRPRARAQARGRGLRGVHARARVEVRRVTDDAHRDRGRRSGIGERLQVRLPRTPTRPRTTSSSRAAGSRTSSSRRSPSTRTSPSGCGSSATSRSTTSSRARCPTWGGERRRDRLRQHLLLHQADREAGRELGGPAGRHQGHLGQARHPRGGEEVPRRRRRPVRVRGRLPQAPGEASTKQGVLFLDMDSGPARARGARQAVLRDDHPAERQQVRGAELGGLVGRLVHLRAAGRADRDAAPGLLPHQRGEHGPVRAHADHRRRGRLRALRRGLHGADLLDRLAALGGRRDHRQEGRPLPLHDDPELVEQRLQPRHQARRRLRGRDDGVGRRQPRLEADDEVPGDLADGRAAPTARCSRSRSPARASTRTRAASASTSRRTRPR